MNTVAMHPDTMKIAVTVLVIEIHNSVVVVDSVDTADIADSCGCSGGSGGTGATGGTGGCGGNGGSCGGNGGCNTVGGGGICGGCGCRAGWLFAGLHAKCTLCSATHLVFSVHVQKSHPYEQRLSL